jgi:hypothetical protein
MGSSEAFFLIGRLLNRRRFVLLRPYKLGEQNLHLASGDEMTRVLGKTLNVLLMVLIIS